MAGFLNQAASSLFARSQIWSAYTAVPNAPDVQVGVWKVTPAKNSAGKLVSVLEYDKGSGAAARRNAGTAVVDALKREVSTLTRMRHPCLLEVVEPLEETRSSLLFAVEPITCCLRDAIASSSQSRRRIYGSGEALELDEVEMQKGMLQVCKALQFLHDSARSAHNNLTTEAIVINAKGDWKLAALAFLHAPTSPPVDVFDPDPSLPMYIQRNLDYMAPELVLDRDQPSPAADMWSLGCIAHALLSKTGDPPFSSRSRIDGYRRQIANLESMRSAWTRYGTEAADLLNSLLLKSPTQRATSANLPQSCSWFSSILVSTLRFLDRDHFPSKSTPEQISFLKGLRSVLPRFSDKVRRNRILPALLEQGLGKSMRRELIPSLLPNIIFISQDLSESQFRADIWPHLKQLFVVAPNDSPENALSLLEHLPALQEKSDAAMFKEEIGPLMLSLLSSTHAPLLVKTLQTIPSMCGGREESDKHALDFVTVRDAVFPEVSKVFVHTTVLGVKVAGLVCLGGMVSVLDKYTLQEKLAPLLSKIRTKDPNVLIASLNVFSLLAGRLTDPIVLSTLILPQLWTMSAAPLLTADQFNRFMALIDGLSRTVKEERGKELRAAARSVPEEVPVASNLTWEELVRGGNQKSQARASNDGVLTPDESKWSNGFSTPLSPPSPQPAPVPARAARQAPALEPAPAPRRTTLGARPVPASSFSFPSAAMEVMQPSTSAPIQPAWSQPASAASSSAMGKPNYNLDMSANATLQPSFAQLGANSAASSMQTSMQPAAPSWAPLPAASMPQMNNPWSSAATPSQTANGSFAVLQPTKAPMPMSNAWKDLDPLG